MTYTPGTLYALGQYWTSQGGKNLGIVGDTAHQAKGVSYHLGKDKLSDTAYSARTARDVSGLTNAASAIDLGRLDGRIVKLRKFSVWLVEQAQALAPGTRDIREIIYSPDGKVVLRWDRERGHQSAPQRGEADNSHLTHTHVSYYRDSEYRSKLLVFKPYFYPTAPPTDVAPSPEELVDSFIVPVPAVDVRVPKNAVLYTTSDLDTTDPYRVVISPGRRMPVAGKLGSGVWAIQLTEEDGTLTNRALFAHKDTLGDPLPLTDAPTNDADCALVAQEAVDLERARILAVIGDTLGI